MPVQIRSLGATFFTFEPTTIERITILSFRNVTCATTRAESTLTMRAKLPANEPSGCFGNEPEYWIDRIRIRMRCRPCVEENGEIVPLSYAVCPKLWCLRVRAA